MPIVRECVPAEMSLIFHVRFVCLIYDRLERAGAKFINVYHCETSKTKILYIRPTRFFFIENLVLRRFANRVFSARLCQVAVASRQDKRYITLFCWCTCIFYSSIGTKKCNYNFYCTDLKLSH